MMAGKISGEEPCFDCPATYRIVVQGNIPESWADRLADMEVMPCQNGDPNRRSTLLGVLRDQSELNGVLETLYRLHLTIVNVEQVGE